MRSPCRALLPAAGLLLLALAARAGEPAPSGLPRQSPFAPAGAPAAEASAAPPNPKAKRLECRCPDATCNPYTAFAAMLCAGIDGIKNEIDPGEPLDVDIYDLSPEELSKIPSTPASLEASLEALEKDHAFLTDTGVFTTDFIENWIEYKLDNEVNPMRLRPHPYEFCLYYDV